MHSFAQKGKATKAYNKFPDFSYSSSEMLCKKHPNSSSVGICPHCLKERLAKLACSDCGESRCSSCSCSDNSSSYRNSCSKMEIGRISTLIENEKIENPHSISRRKDDLSEKFVFLKRSSSCVEIKKRNGFWKIKKLFGNRKRKNNGCSKNSEFCDERSGIWTADNMGVSKSRSLCSYRGGRYSDLDEQSDCAFSSAKISDVSSGIFFDSDKKSGFSCESESRKSGFRGALKNPVKESDFRTMDESAFIDLKLDSFSESKRDLRVNERGRRNVWKWIFKYNSAAKEEN